MTLWSLFRLNFFIRTFFVRTFSAAPTVPPFFNKIENTKRHLERPSSNVWFAAYAAAVVVAVVVVVISAYAAVAVVVAVVVLVISAGAASLGNICWKNRCLLKN